MTRYQNDIHLKKVMWILKKFTYKANLYLNFYVIILDKVKNQAFVFNTGIIWLITMWQVCKTNIT